VVGGFAFDLGSTLQNHQYDAHVKKEEAAIVVTLVLLGLVWPSSRVRALAVCQILIFDEA
jgi:hypothetical protein